MDVYSILNDDDFNILSYHSDILGNPDCVYVEDLLLHHALELDIKEYALLRLVVLLRDKDE